MPKLNERFYKALDPTWDQHVALYPNYARSVILGENNNTKKDPVADAAWKKRLGLNYDSKYLPSNSDGSVRLPLVNEQEIEIDTNAIKKRIFSNRDYIGKNSANVKKLIDLDQDYLDKLRRMYNKGEVINVNEFQTWKNRKMLDKNKNPTNNISPANIMKNYHLYHDPKKNQVHYEDGYDFNAIDFLIPGKEFKIRGIVPK